MKKALLCILSVAALVSAMAGSVLVNRIDGTTASGATTTNTLGYAFAKQNESWTGTVGYVSCVMLRYPSISTNRVDLFVTRENGQMLSYSVTFANSRHATFYPPSECFIQSGESVVVDNTAGSETLTFSVDIAKARK